MSVVDVMSGEIHGAAGEAELTADGGLWVERSDALGLRRRAASCGQSAIMLYYDLKKWTTAPVYETFTFVCLHFAKLNL